MGSDSFWKTWFSMAVGDCLSVRCVVAASLGASWKVLRLRGRPFDAQIRRISLFPVDAVVINASRDVESFFPALDFARSESPFIFIPDGIVRRYSVGSLSFWKSPAVMAIGIERGLLSRGPYKNMRHRYDGDGERPSEIFPSNFHDDFGWNAASGHPIQPIDTVVIHDWSIARNLLIDTLLRPTALKASEYGIGEYDYDADSFYWLQPRFILGSLINLLSITITLVLTVACAVCGLSVVQNEVPRQPDADAAWFTLWVGIAILAIGQGFALCAICLAVRWF